MASVQLTFVTSSKGGKLIVHESNAYRKNAVNGRSTYFSCSQKQKGCPAGIYLYDYNPVTCDYSSYRVKDAEHEGHSSKPHRAVRKLLKREEPAAVVDKNVVCLFCLTGLPADVVNARVLTNLAPDGKDLCTTLNNPNKNLQSFELLCRLLNIDGAELRWANVLSFDPWKCLPLCLKCQNLYQEVFQLHSLIHELEKQVTKRVELIKVVVQKSKYKAKATSSQLNFLGFNVFREKVATLEHTNAASLTASTLDDKSDVFAAEKGNLVVEDRDLTLTHQVKVEVSDNDYFEHNDEKVADEIMGWKVEGMEEFSQEVDTACSDGNLVPKSTEESDSCAQSFERPKRTRLSKTQAEDPSYESGSNESFGSEDDSDSDASYKNTRSTSKRRPRRKNKAQGVVRGRRRVFGGADVNSLLKDLVCHICDESICGGHGSRSMKTHYMEKHPKEDKFTCIFCQKHFTRLLDCLDHQRAHRGEEPYTCKYCPKHFTSTRSRLSHYHLCHPKVIPRLYQCKECSENFASESLLEAHLPTHDEHIIVCKMCGNVFKCKMYFIKHNQRQHNGKAECSKPISPTPTNLQSFDVQVKAISKCHLCLMDLYGKFDTTKHFEEYHPGANPNECRCGRVFKSYKKVRVHAMQHVERTKSFACDKCDKLFSSRQQLQKHNNVHLRKTKFSKIPGERVSQPRHVCEHCGNSYSGKLNLRKHVKRVHKGIKKRKAERGPTNVADESASSDYDTDDAFMPKNDSELDKIVKSRQRPDLSAKEYTCHLCDQVLVGYITYMEHYEDVHPNEKKWTCRFCKQHFKDLRQVETHQRRKHTGERPFKCHLCDKFYYSEHARRTHLVYTHRETSACLPCEQCGKLFATEALLKSHLPVHDETVVICKSCGKVLKSLCTFVTHNKKIHEGKALCSEPLTNPREKDFEALGVIAGSTITCHLCMESIYGKVNLKKHFDEVHEGWPPNQCRCGKTFKTYKACRQHAIRHTDFKPYMCDKCDRKFYTTTELNNHSLVHDESKPRFACELCGKSLVSKVALAQHQKRHEEGRSRHVCEICGRSYAEKKGYIHHMRKEHWNVKPHHCTYCPQTYVLRSELLKHIQTHTKTKPYKCPLCDKHFPYTSSRSRHVREVHQKQTSRGLGKKFLKDFKVPEKKTGNAETSGKLSHTHENKDDLLLTADNSSPSAIDDIGTEELKPLEHLMIHHDFEKSPDYSLWTPQY